MTEPKAYILDAPGAELHYDVRSNDSSGRPTPLLIGSPRGSAPWRDISPTVRS